MLTKVLLISESEIKNGSVIEQNVDSLILSKTIDDVQQIYLKPILGADLFDAVISSAYEFEVNGVAILPLYSELLVIIKAYLLNKVVPEFIIPNAYKITAKGLMKLSDNSASNLSSSDTDSVKDYYDNLSSTYKENLIKFLVDNNLIDNYNSNTNIAEEATGWYLGPTVVQKSFSSNTNNSVPTVGEPVKGDKGDRGPQGIQGIQGATGSTGPKGLTGAKGDKGIQGDKGDIGITGATGARGLTGVAGSNGVKGAIGSNGLQGPQGVAGAVGSQGATGPQGVKGNSGSNGLKGDTGNVGLTGPIGPKGLTGNQGVQGATGSQGIQGIKGLAGLINKGVWLTGTTYIPGDYVISKSSLSASKNSIWILQGTVPYSSITTPNLDYKFLELVMPDGPQGVQGIKGDTGNQGVQGIEGVMGGDTQPYQYLGTSGSHPSEPPAGVLKFSNSNLALVNDIHLSTTNGVGIVIDSWLNTLGSSNSLVKGKLRVFNIIDKSKYVDFNITGVNIYSPTWYVVTVTYLSGDLINLQVFDDLLISFSKTGDTGSQGNIGLTGATGLQGIQGIKGDTGLTGATGLQGPAGVSGITYVNTYAALTAAAVGTSQLYFVVKASELNSGNQTCYTYDGNGGVYWVASVKIVSAPGGTNNQFPYALPFTL